MLNRPRATLALEHAGLNAVISTTPENVLYASGVYSFVQWYRRGVPAFAVVGRDPALPGAVVLPMVDASAALDLPAGARAYFYSPFVYTVPEGNTLSQEEERLRDLVGGAVDATAPEALARALRDLGLGGGQLGVDTAGLWPIRWQDLSAALPQATLHDAHDLLTRVRMVKTAGEIALLRGAAQATEQAFATSLSALRQGITEAEVARVYEGALAAQGAQPSLTTIAFGPHGAYPTAQPGERRLTAGTVIRYDIGCRYHGYYADMARNVAFGDPSPRVHSYYEALCAGEQAGLGAVRPGASASQLFQATVERTREAGIPHYQRAHVGHSIGLSPYDAPMLAPGDNTVLEPGMVINIEAPYYEVGFGGLQVEDTVVVTDDGCAPLTTAPRGMRIVPA